MATETKPQKNDFEGRKTDIQRHQHSGVIAAVLISLGVILLLNNLGIISWNIWNSLFQFWPIILILFGLEIILGKNWLSRWLVALISLAVATYLVVATIAPSNPIVALWLKQYLPWLQQY
jgi:hypothetical protein